MAIGLTTDGRVFTVRLSPDVSEQINTLAQREYETPTTVLRRLVRWDSITSSASINFVVLRPADDVVQRRRRAPLLAGRITAR